MANITQNGGTPPATISNGVLQVALPLSGTLQQVTDQLGNPSTIFVSSAEMSLNRGLLTNFTPRYQTGGTLAVNGSNNDTLNASVYGLTGAVTISFDLLFDGFSMSFIQLDTNLPTFVASGVGYILANRQGHNTTAGQYAMVSIFFHNNVVYFGGDTA
jgi:hypothetical protein